MPTWNGEALPTTIHNVIGSSQPRCDKRWFALYTASRHEKQVQKQLADKNTDAFLPVYSIRREWKKRKSVHIDLPLFPNYVFVCITSRERAAVLGTPGVFSFVGSTREAWELPERDIEALRNASLLGKLEPHPYLVVGERARVRSGPLAGLEGVIIRKKKNFQIVMSLDQIMRSVAIEVEAGDLEPLSPSLN
ncbi:MAG TPA: UpxY family transcription antiterminator [Candidatus Aquilonibacter sp.]|nr:UpxY family transcription antiterminator [Candidatus Aquilonibacter sp.]